MICIDLLDISSVLAHVRACVPSLLAVCVSPVSVLGVRASERASVHVCVCARVCVRAFVVGNSHVIVEVYDTVADVLRVKEGVFVQRVRWRRSVPTPHLRTAVKLTLAHTHTKN